MLVAAGGGMMGQAFPDTITRTAAVVAPGLMVMAIIMFMGKISGAHLNPAVSIAFSLRGDFPWRRVPGYVIVQLLGATLASLVLWGVVDVSAKYGGNYPAGGYSDWRALAMETVLTFGLVSVILGTASGAQNLGIIGAIGVGSYIALAGLWGSPISGASMNPARTFGPDLVSGTWTGYWLYIVGPIVGACIAVGLCLRPPRSGRRPGGIGRGARRALHQGKTPPGLSKAPYDPGMAEFLHTMVRITDPEKSRAFYEALGFHFERDMDIVRNGEIEATNYFYGIGDHGSVLELTFNHDGRTYDLGTGYGHIAVSVDDLEQSLAELKQQGIEAEREPYRVREGGSLICFVQDPDGYRIELIDRSGR